MMRLFGGNLKPKWHDFSQYGYFGAVRNFELTFKGDSYHPHIHCFIALRQGLNLEQKHLNAFSYSQDREPYLFNDLEILLQKVWYLAENKGNITQRALDECELGYSVFCSRILDGRYGEVFKYMVKPHSDFMTFEQFNTMRKAMHGRRLMQGYGALYSIKDDVEQETVNMTYLLVRAALQAVSTPIEESRSLQQIVDEAERGVTIISRESCNITVDDLNAIKTD